MYADNFNYTKETLQIKLSVSEEEAERILNLYQAGPGSHSVWLMFMYSRLLLARIYLTKMAWSLFLLMIMNKQI